MFYIYFLILCPSYCQYVSFVVVVFLVYAGHQSMMFVWSPGAAKRERRKKIFSVQRTHVYFWFCHIPVVHIPFLFLCIIFMNSLLTPRSNSCFTKHSVFNWLLLVFYYCCKEREPRYLSVVLVLTVGDFFCADLQWLCTVDAVLCSCIQLASGVLNMFSFSYILALSTH